MNDYLLETYLQANLQAATGNIGDGGNLHYIVSAVYKTTPHKYTSRYAHPHPTTYCTYRTQ